MLFTTKLKKSNELKKAIDETFELHEKVAKRCEILLDEHAKLMDVREGLMDHVDELIKLHSTLFETEG